MISSCLPQHRVAHSALLEKLQRYETAVLANEQKVLVVRTQAEDINDLTSKLYQAKDAERELRQSVMLLQESLNSSREEAEHLRAEVYRLQKGLLEVSVRQSDKSRALRPQSRSLHTADLGKRASSAMGATSQLQGSLSALHFTESVTECSVTANSLSPKIMNTSSFGSRPTSSASVISPMSSPHRAHVAIRRVHSMGSFSADCSGDVLSASSNDMQMHSLPPLSDIVAPSPSSSSMRAGTAPSNQVSSSSKRTTDLSVKNKTMYVGVGLGLKQEPTFSPKGSAKMMLRKIMDDFNNSEN